ncbi:hypothetical protein BDV38DRAFT_125921 [Aspergillus pseudotamarii]|uniref:Uncharacterized protein n=1 Tax=Aspergillus pseudotamarii TaxID=132259 RepID=A0A5N6T827_ASPPS|nr:uncharacterized protein BDV38DRAFT_125921 [Aspergillus pseudotamarii]KAE8142534.1 hypothetical protein BDV38DRAFT_125921 [Aspergillus pseudotamarii]
MQGFVQRLTRITPAVSRCSASEYYITTTTSSSTTTAMGWRYGSCKAAPTVHAQPFFFFGVRIGLKSLRRMIKLSSDIHDFGIVGLG